MLFTVTSLFNAGSSWQRWFTFSDKLGLSSSFLSIHSSIYTNVQNSTFTGKIANFTVTQAYSKQIEKLKCTWILKITDVTAHLYFAVFPSSDLAVQCNAFYQYTLTSLPKCYFRSLHASMNQCISSFGLPHA